MGNLTGVYKKDAGGKVVESEEYVYNESSQLTEATIYDGKKTASMSYTYDGDGNRVFQLNYNLHLQCGTESASDKTAFYAGRCYFEVKMLEADLGVAAITVKGIYEGVQSGITRLGTLLDDSIGIGGGGAAVIAANGSAAYAGLGNLAAIGALLSAAPGSLSGMEQRLGRLQENFEKMLESGKGGSGAGKGDSGSSELENVYNSIKESPNYPEGFEPRQNGTTRNTVKNKGLLEKLREIESGTWKKVYKDGYDINGNEISIHYFQSESGKVFDVKVKPGWSN